MKIMPDVQPQKIEVPLSVKSPTSESLIFSMPEKFRGLAAKISPPTMKPAALPPPIVPPKRNLPPPPTLAKKGGTSKINRAVLVAGAVLLVVVGGTGLYVYFAFKPAVIQPVNKSNVSVTANRSVDQTNISSSTNTSSNQSANQQTTTPVSPFPNNSQPGRDTDSDGLTDVEEILYKTSSKKPDTDSDGFLDGNEVFHGYDPNAPSPITLNDSEVVAVYSSEEPYAFHFDYPSAWLLKLDPKKAGDLILTVPSGEVFSLSFEEKTVETDLASWFSGVNPSDKTTVTLEKTKGGLEMLVTEDKMTVYIEGGSKVLVFSYQNTIKATVDYLMTFEMMVNSLFLGPDYASR